MKRYYHTLIVLTGITVVIYTGVDIFYRLVRHAWQVDVQWREGLPAYFAALAAGAGAEEYARAVVGVIEEFDDYDRTRHLRDARAGASPAPKKALRGA